MLFLLHIREHPFALVHIDLTGVYNFFGEPGQSAGRDIGAVFSVFLSHVLVIDTYLGLGQGSADMDKLCQTQAR